MKAVILVAGVSRRLFPLTEHRPKCLLEVGGKTILDHQLDAMREVGIREVCLVLGYRREQIMQHVQKHHSDLDFSFRINHHFYDTNTAWSLWLAGDDFLDCNFVYANGDVLFEPRLLQRVVASEHPAALALERKVCGEEEVKAQLDENGRIIGLSKEIDPKLCAGEFIGVARFDATITAPFFNELAKLQAAGERQAYFEAALHQMSGEHALHTVDVTDYPCIEIDFPEDYQNACRDVVARFGKNEG